MAPGHQCWSHLNHRSISLFWSDRSLMAGWGWGPSGLQAEASPCRSRLDRSGIWGLVWGGEWRRPLRAIASPGCKRGGVSSNIMLPLPSLSLGWHFTSGLLAKIKTPLWFILKLSWKGKCLTTPLLALPLCAVCNDPERINWTLHFKDKDWDFTSG